MRVAVSPEGVVSKSQTFEEREEEEEEEANEEGKKTSHPSSIAALTSQAHN